MPRVLTWLLYLLTGCLVTLPDTTSAKAALEPQGGPSAGGLALPWPDDIMAPGGVQDDPPAGDAFGLQVGPNLYAYVRQNPWTAFDPLGLNETFGWNNWFADWVVPDPVGSYNEANRQLDIAVDAEGQHSGWERAGGVLGAFGHGVGTVVDCIPGIGKAKTMLLKKVAGEVLEEGTEAVVKQGVKRLDNAGEKTAKEISQDAAKHTDAAAKKRGPKPKSEGGPHNEKIDEIGGQLDEGETLVAGGGRKPEVLIPTPGGTKTGRRPDKLVERSDGSLKGTNVGKTKSDGTPIKREQDALDDLRGAGVEMDYVSYDK